MTTPSMFHMVVAANSIGFLGNSRGGPWRRLSDERSQESIKTTRLDRWQHCGSWSWISELGGQPWLTPRSQRQCLAFARLRAQFAWPSCCLCVCRAGCPSRSDEYAWPTRVQAKQNPDLETWQADDTAKSFASCKKMPFSAKLGGSCKAHTHAHTYITLRLQYIALCSVVLHSIALR